MVVGLLGLQGAFLDHIRHLDALGIAHRIVRDPDGLQQVSRLIIPGGESTVMDKFLLEFGMMEPLRERIAGGMPTWGICAGAVLLAETVDGRPGSLRALPMSVIRNAYGRQLASRVRPIEVPILEALGRHGPFSGVFIRAPRISALGAGVVVHARSKADPVFVQRRRVMATTFHPELTSETVFHRYFIGL